MSLSVSAAVVWSLLVVPANAEVQANPPSSSATVAGGDSTATAALPEGDPDSTGTVQSTPAAPEVDPNDPVLRAAEQARRARSKPGPAQKVEAAGVLIGGRVGMQRALEPPDPNPYRATYSVLPLVNKPNYRYQGEQTVWVTNRSSVTWSVTDGGYEYYLGYTLYQDGVATSGFAGSWAITQLPHSVAPGETVQVSGVIGVLAPGDYSIEWVMAGSGSRQFSDYGDPAAEPNAFSIQHQNSVAETRPAYEDNVAYTTPPAALYGQVYGDRTLAVDVQMSLCTTGSRQCWSSGWLPVTFAPDANAASVSWAPPSGAITTAQSYEWTIQLREGAFVSEVSPPARFTVLGPSSPAALPSASTLGPGLSGPGGGVGTGSSSSPAGQAQGRRGDPVNTATGGFSTTVTDLRAEGPGVPLWVTRTYNSIDQTSGAFGPGWTWSFGMRMWRVASGDVTVRGGDGQQVSYRPSAGSAYTSPPGFRGVLTKTASGWDLRARPSGEHYVFDATGLLVGYTNRSRLGVTLSYLDGRVARVTYAGGRSVSFTWGTGPTDGRIVRAAFWDGRAVTYGYTGGGLTSVTDPRGKVTKYAYDSPGTGMLASMTDPNGHRQYLNTYDPASRRVVEQTDARGMVTSFGWDSSTGTATTTYPRGGVVTDTYVGNVLTQTRDANGFSTGFGYDGRLNRTYVTDRRGNTTFFKYDAAGNVTQQTDAVGGVRSWTYNTEDQVLTDTSARTTDGVRDFTTVNTYDTATGNLASTRTPGGSLTTWTYFPNGQLRSLTSPRGNVPGASAATKAQFTTTYDYAAGSLDLAKVTTGSGRVTSFGYDVMGRRTRVTSPRGNVEGCGCADTFSTLTRYNATDHVATVSDSRSRAAGRSASNTYDDAGNLSIHTDPTGATQTHAYNEANLPTTVTDGEGRAVSSTTYDNDGNVGSLRQGSRMRVLYSRDLGGRITATQPLTSSCGTSCAARFAVRYTLDANGNQTNVDAPNGSTTGDKPGGRSVSYATFDAVNRVTYAKDAAGGVTRYTYDGNGNVLTVQDPAGAVTTQVWDRDDRAIETVDAVGRSTHSDYDADDNLVKRVNAADQAQTWAYDSNDEQVSATEPRGNVAGCGCSAAYTTHYSHTVDGDLSEIVDARNASTTYGYDSQGNQVSVRDAKGRTTTLGYDLAGRLRSVLAPDAATANKPMTYAYSPKSGLLMQQTAPQGGTTAYVWDAYGQLASKTTGVGTWSYEYDLAGKVVAETLPAGNATAVAGDGLITYAYNDAQQLARAGYGSASTSPVMYGYDPVGRRTLVQNGSGSVTYAYNGTGTVKTTTRTRVVTSSAPAAVATNSYSYYPDGALHTVTRPDKSIETWNYGDDARPSVTAVTGKGTTTYAWTPAGQLASVTDPRGITEQHIWDHAGNLDRVSTSRGTSVLSTSVVTGRDLTGNPTQIDTSRGAAKATRSYLYDLADRLTADCATVLTSCTSASATQAWTYDLDGNRVTEKNGTGAGILTRYRYDTTSDQLTGITVGATPARPVTYDGNGNQLSDGVTSRTYGAFNQVRTSTAGGVTTSFARDGLGVLLSASTPAASTTYDWDVTGPVPQLQSSMTGAAVSSFRYDALGRPASMTAGGATYTYAHDTTGSVTDLLAGTGVVARSYAYSAFGSPVTPVGVPAGTTQTGPDSPLRYTGMLTADNGASYSTPNRTYAPGLGRWSSLDPVAPDAGRAWDSPYTYVGNRPFVFADPLGQSASPLPDLLGVFTGQDDRDALRAIGDAAWETGPGLVGAVADKVGDGLDHVGVANPGHAIHDRLDGVQGTLDDWSGGSAGTPIYNAIYGAGTAAAIVLPGAGEARAARLLDEATNAARAVEAGAAVADEWPVISGIVRDASAGKGNFGLGTGTASQATRAGESWVGDGYRVASDGKTLVSSDGLRAFRPPSWKPNLGKYQANFEHWVDGQVRGEPMGNGHFDVTDLLP